MSGCESTLLGKTVGQRVYIYACHLNSAAPELQIRATAALQLAPPEAATCNVIRVESVTESVSFLEYPRFLEEACPSLTRSWKVHLDTAQVGYRDYRDSFNPPILHRKELLLAPNDTHRGRFAALTAQLESLGLFDDPVRIGFRQQWERLLLDRGFRLVGHDLIPIGNTEWDAPAIQDSDPLQPIERHLTALTRHEFSAPIQLLARFGLLTGSVTVFDYGCGKGNDVAGLKRNGIDAVGWDPHFAPNQSLVARDVVNLGFVINVIEDPVERRDALRRAFELTRRVLAVSTMIASDDSVKGTPFADGVLTGRHTFQKYYVQTELREYLTQVLEHDPIPVAPGVFFVFRDKELEQSFQANRFRARIRLQPAARISRPRTQPSVVPDARQADVYKLHGPSCEALWQRWLDLGRAPDEADIPEFVDLFAAAGSFRRALRLVASHHDQKQLLVAHNQRRADLLVYLALQEFQQRKPFKQLDRRLQRDIRAFFGDYRSGRDEALQLLGELARAERLDQHCRLAAEQGLGFLEDSDSLQVHSCLIPRLPSALRVYVGCAEVLYGALNQVDLVKIHIRSGKVSLLKSDGFATSPLPRLVERTKITLPRLDVRLFQYGNRLEAPYVYLKSRFMNEEMPGYSEQLAFDEQLQSLNIVDLTGYGPSPADFDAALRKARWKIEGMVLVRDNSIPDLDAPCGKYLTYRDLVHCGETRARLNLSNMPKSPKTFTALYDLATSLLDPVIEYFGSIKLTYGFCSAGLAKEIPSHIAPALDQHAAHENKRSGSPICARLGAAADFLVEDENMREVANWISANLPFDRLYYYGPDRPIHVSFGPEAKGEFVELRTLEGGRRIPTVKKSR